MPGRAVSLVWRRLFLFLVGFRFCLVCSLETTLLGVPGQKLKVAKKVDSISVIS